MMIAIYISIMPSRRTAAGIPPRGGMMLKMKRITTPTGGAGIANGGPSR